MAETKMAATSVSGNVIESRRQVSEPGSVITVQRVTVSQQMRESFSKAIQQGRNDDTTTDR